MVKTVVSFHRILVHDRILISWRNNPYIIGYYNHLQYLCIYIYSYYNQGQLVIAHISSLLSNRFPLGHSQHFDHHEFLEIALALDTIGSCIRRFKMEGKSSAEWKTWKQPPNHSCLGPQVPMKNEGFTPQIMGYKVITPKNEGNVGSHGVRYKGIT